VCFCFGGGGLLWVGEWFFGDGVVWGFRGFWLLGGGGLGWFSFGARHGGGGGVGVFCGMGLGGGVGRVRLWCVVVCVAWVLGWLGVFVWGVLLFFWGGLGCAGCGAGV